MAIIIFICFLSRYVRRYSEFETGIIFGALKKLKAKLENSFRSLVIRYVVLHMIPVPYCQGIAETYGGWERRGYRCCLGMQLLLGDFLYYSTDGERLREVRTRGYGGSQDE